jgi:hypothetical protein
MSKLLLHLRKSIMYNYCIKYTFHRVKVLRYRLDCAQPLITFYKIITYVLQEFYVSMDVDKYLIKECQ